MQVGYFRNLSLARCLMIFENMEVELTIEEIEELIRDLPKIICELDEDKDGKELV